MIPRYFIDELVERSDIVAIIGERLPLKRRGRDHWGCCPFHDEKTPSFKVDGNENFYKCFGCGKGGNVVQFLIEHDRMEFPEAVEALAQRAGMDIPRDTEVNSAAMEQTRRLRELMEQCVAFYRNQLTEAPAGRKARNYLEQRSLTPSTAERFSLGYAPDSWDSLLRELGADQRQQRLLEQAGMLVSKDSGRCYDRFRDRIMFPIKDERGRVIGFGGRCIGDGEPKYLNSPETPLFHKSQELYGLDQARRRERGLERLLVVEGYMDVIALAQHGVDGAVATLGTALTEQHLKKLFRVVPEVVFCFDGDSAGRRAAAKALELASRQLEDGLQARFLMLPEGEDPDSLVQAEGKKAFEARIAGSTSLVEQLLSEQAGDSGLDSVEARAAFAHRVESVIQNIPGKYIRDLALARLAEMTRIDPQVLKSHASPAVTEIEHPPARVPSTPAPAPERSAPMASLRPQARRRSPVAKCLHALLWNPALAAGVDYRKLLPSSSEEELLVRMLEWLQDDPALSHGVMLGWAAALGGTHSALLAELVEETPLLDQDGLASEFRGVIEHLISEQDSSSDRKRLLQLQAKARSGGLDHTERNELLSLLRNLNVRTLSKPNQNPESIET